MSIHEIKLLQLQNALAESHKECAAARQRVASVEERAHVAVHAVNESLWQQIKDLQHASASADRRAHVSEVQKQV